MYSPIYRVNPDSQSHIDLVPCYSSERVFAQLQMLGIQLSWFEKLQVNFCGSNFLGTKRKLLKMLAYSTKNVGLQVLMLQNLDLLTRLVTNPHFNLALVPSVLGIAERYSSEELVDELILGRAVCADMKTFKFIVKKYANDEKKILWWIRILLVHRPKNLSTGTLLFLFSYLKDHDDEIAYLSSHAKARIESRKPEVEAWVNVNMPEFVDIPLSWVLEMVDLYV